jgi:hypothetical protein
MRKGVSISVQLFIQGDDAPAHDFTQTGRDVALQVLQQGLQHYQGPYAIQVQKLTPLEGSDVDSDESDSGDALDVKPLLSYTPAGQRPATSTQSAAATPPTPAPATSSRPAAGQPAAQQHPPEPSSQPEPPQQPQHPEKHHFWDRSSE